MQAGKRQTGRQSQIPENQGASGKILFLKLRRPFEAVILDIRGFLVRIDSLPKSPGNQGFLPKPQGEI
jgi:hypothetical protein